MSKYNGSSGFYLISSPNYWMSNILVLDECFVFETEQERIERHFNGRRKRIQQNRFSVFSGKISTTEIDMLFLVGQGDRCGN